VVVNYLAIGVSTAAKDNPPIAVDELCSWLVTGLIMTRERDSVVVNFPDRKPITSESLVQVEQSN
jgi:hypothetical protein